QELGNRRGIAICLEGLAGLGVPRDGDPAHPDETQENAERAARLFGAAEALREAIHSSIPAAWRAEYEESFALLRAALGEERFTAAWAEGRAVPLQEVIRDAEASRG